jgi:hypothetical protein
LPKKYPKNIFLARHGFRLGRFPGSEARRIRRQLPELDGHPQPSWPLPHSSGRQARWVGQTETLPSYDEQQREDEMSECDEDGLQDKYDTVAGILDALPAHAKLIIIIALLNACRKALMRDGGLTRLEATERLVKYLNDFEEERDQAPSVKGDVA